MTIAQFRRLALSLPEAEERAHMGHPDFRVKEKIFATLFPRDKRTWGVLKLKPDQQRVLVKAHSDVFQPVPGGWGRQGATQVRLERARVPILRDAMITAWRNVAPKSLVQEQGLSDED
ncbi:MAG TPA: MmcQ/YjbR family DNA-binding protein [Phycisphaerae bacterium]|nr:MmcQ/YjbR family DNA-binding protein [Phycisphaerae bacterium]